MKEKEVAWEIERFLREKGSEPVPFDIIVASGPNAALPHAKPTERTISPGEPIMVDLGARVEGYSSDLSRTLYLGSREGDFAKIYDLVLQAQLFAITNLETGMTGEQVDNLARTVIRQEGYEDAFVHGLGHGIGLATHEQPRLGPKATGVIAESMVFTIEPGIYLSGWGGVRIEDMVMVEKGKAKTLTKFRK
jgi:Xaa-Pro aminopeptidase